jgi:hypothetical protein
MRALVLLSSCFLAIACGSPHSGPAETLVMPKKKKQKEPGAESTATPLYGGLQEPDTCKWDFGGKEQPQVKKAAADKAKSIAQDGMNAMAGIDKEMGMARRNKVVEALGILNDALRVDPYSPQATYAMAVAYAHVGKKQCALAMLDRLTRLSGFPDIAPDVQKVAGRAKVEAAFEPFRKEADQALGGG